MKLTRLKGIALDLAHHLSLEMWYGSLKDMPKKISTNILEEKDSFDRKCVKFFRERLPKSFDFIRVENIRIDIERTMTSMNISIKVEVEGHKFNYQCKSMIG